ncbi:Kinesin motor family protein [Forsythia ovata]|uniref:Kinesin motor family protein n=1 Tax=Forsythia ovata TaxID=205694 RepID=A0ABD1T782_9LAMI
MGVLEQRIIENSDASLANASFVEMQEVSYSKELAHVVAVIPKILADEITMLSLHNAKLEKELQAAREMMNSKNGGNRKYNDGKSPSRRGRLNRRTNDAFRMLRDEFDSWNIDPDDLKIEFQVRKQQEISLKTALA